MAAGHTCCSVGMYSKTGLQDFLKKCIPSWIISIPQTGQRPLYFYQQQAFPPTPQALLFLPPVLQPIPGGTDQPPNAGIFPLPVSDASKPPLLSSSPSPTPAHIFSLFLSKNNSDWIYLPIRESKRSTKISVQEGREISGCWRARMLPDAPHETWNFLLSSVPNPRLWSILICIFLITNEAEHLFICLLSTTFLLRREH